MSKCLLSLAVCIVTVSAVMAIDPIKPPNRNLGDTATHEVGHVRMQPGRTTNWSIGASNPTPIIRKGWSLGASNPTSLKTRTPGKSRRMK